MSHLSTAVAEYMYVPSLHQLKDNFIDMHLPNWIIIFYVTLHVVNYQSSCDARICMFVQKASSSPSVMMAAVVPEVAEERHAGWQDQVVPNLPDNNGSKQSPPDSRCKSTIFLVRMRIIFAIRVQTL